MKRLLVLLALYTCVLGAYADDVIVNLDGTSIQSKIEEVSQKEIKYKKADNLDGPTYTIEKSQVKTIIYENGTIEDIAQIRLNTNYQKSGKNMKIASWIVGGSMLLGGLIIAAKATSDFNSGSIDSEDLSSKRGWGYALMGAGAVSWGVLYFRGRALEKKAQRFQTSQIQAFEIPLNHNQKLMTSVDIVNDTHTGNNSYGLGLSYKF